MNRPPKTHWVIHCLGIIGLLATFIALRSLISGDTHQLPLACFDLIFGLAELAIAAFYVLHPHR